MDNLRRYLLRRGQDCVILRNPVVNTKIDMKISTRAIQNETARESYWEGVVLADSNLNSGEVIEVKGIRFLTQTVLPNTFGELLWYGVKINASLDLINKIETVDENGYITETTVVVASIPAYGESINAALRQAKPGLLPNAIWIFQIPATYNVKAGDLLVFNGKKLQVEAVNTAFLEGVVEIQCSEVVA